MDERNRGGILNTEVGRLWRVLALQTRRLALFLRDTGRDEALNRAKEFEKTAKLLEQKANEFEHVGNGDSSKLADDRC